MGGFVNLQPAGAPLVAMPPPEVVRPVRSVQQPLELDRQHLADHAVHQQFLDLRPRRGVSIVERHAHRPAGPVDRIDDPLAPGRVDGHGLLGNHVAAVLQGQANVMVMQVVRRGDDHAIQLFFADHRLKFVGWIGFHPWQGFTHFAQGQFQAPGIRIAQRRQYRRIPVLAHQGMDKISRSSAKTHNTKSLHRQPNSICHTLQACHLPSAAFPNRPCANRPGRLAAPKPLTSQTFCETLMLLQ